MTEISHTQSSDTAYIRLKPGVFATHA